MNDITIRVTLRNMQTGEVSQIKTGNHNDKDFRVWMGKAAFWALRNGHAMMTEPVNDIAE